MCYQGLQSISDGPFLLTMARNASRAERAYSIVSVRHAIAVPSSYTAVSKVRSAVLAQT